MSKNIMSILDLSKMDKTPWTPGIIYRQWGVVCSRPFDRCVKLIERKGGLQVAPKLRARFLQSVSYNTANIYCKSRNLPITVLYITYRFAVISEYIQTSHIQLID